MRPPARALIAAAASLGVTHALPALAAVRGGRALFPTVRHVAGPGRVGLTFDDGPEAGAIEHFLEALEALDVKATFFVVGEQTRRSPESTRKIVAAGHEIACHGYRHRNHLRLSPHTTIRDLIDARDVISGETGAEIHHFRPPYGVFNATSWAACGHLGWDRVLWARWGRDWEARATPESIRAKVMDGLADGDVILLHDGEAYSSVGSWRRTLAALEPIVTELRARGLEPGPIGRVGPGHLGGMPDLTAGGDLVLPGRSAQGGA